MSESTKIPNVTPVYVNQAKWNSLTEAEKLLAKRMGIGPKPSASCKSSDPLISNETRRLAKTTKDIKPYILGIVIDCQLCGETEIHLYDMIKSTNGKETLLIANRSRSNTCTPDKWEVRKVRSCSCCRQVLSTQPKPLLVTKILQLASGSFYRSYRTTRKEDIKNVK